MTKEQINKILEKASKMDLLSAIEFLTGEEKEYMRGEFHKKTRIPLLQLFREFLNFNKLMESPVKAILNDFSRYEDYELIAEKVVDLLDFLNKNPDVIVEFEKFFINFMNSDEIGELSNKLDEQIKRLKN